MDISFLEKINGILQPTLTTNGMQPPPSTAGRWLPIPSGSIKLPNDTYARWMYIQDGDSPYYLGDIGSDPNVIYGSSRPNAENMPGLYGGRALGYDAPETQHSSDKPADAFANASWQYYSDLHTQLIENGYTIEVLHEGVTSSQGYGRDLVLEYLYDKNGHEVGTISEIMLANGMAQVDATASNNETNSKSYLDFHKAAEIGSSRNAGFINNPLYRLTYDEDVKRYNDKHSELREGKHNSKFEQDRRRNREIGDNEYKIGDVYLNPSPVAITISQARTSYDVPLLGYESKPTSSYTTRTIIKLQCIFPNAIDTGDLQRILLQFKYCPINLIRSKDLFAKVAEDIKGKKGNSVYLSNLQRDYAGTFCVPVTMDEWVIYTMEGHPDTIGATFQFSLFNYTAYFNDSPLDRVEYFKYRVPKTKAEAVELSNGRLVTDDYIKAHDPRMAKLIEKKKITIPDNKKILYRDKTLNLEDSIHPYNFSVEDDLVIMGETFRNFEDLKESSGVRIWKVSTARTKKVMRIQNKFDPESFTDYAAKIEDSIINEKIVRSISIKGSNTFGWLPVLGYSLPVAQYTGPGSTYVNINFNTRDNNTISKLLKSYNEIVEKDDIFGMYDDRYIVSNALTVFSQSELCSLKDLSINSVPGHPGVSDVNITFQKTTYTLNAKEINPAAEKDNYWGINRILDPIQKNAQYAAMINQLMKTTYAEMQDGTFLQQTNKKNVPTEGLEFKTKEALEIVLKRLTQVSGGLPTFPDGKKRTGKDLYDKLVLASAASTVTGTAGTFVDMMKKYINEKAKEGNGHVSAEYWDIKKVFNNLNDKASLNLKRDLILLASGDNMIDISKIPLAKQIEIVLKNQKSGKGTKGLLLEMANDDFVLGVEDQNKVNEVYKNMAPFWQEYGKYWSKKYSKQVYAKAEGLTVTYNFNGYPEEVAVLKEILQAGNSVGYDKGANEATLKKYSEYWSETDRQQFPSFGVEYGFVNGVESTYANTDQNKQYQYSVSLVYKDQPGRGVKSVDTSADSQAIQKIQKQFAEVMKKINLDAMTISKPFAAHRYYPRCDDYIFSDALLSLSVGEWYANSKILELDGLLNKVGSIVSELQSPLSNSNAWKAAFKQWGINEPGGQFDTMIDDYGPLGVLQAVAYPDLKRDMSYTRTNGETGLRPFIDDNKVDTSINIVPSKTAWETEEASQDTSRGTKPVNSSDRYLSSMSQMFMSKGFGNVAPKISEQQQKWISNTLIQRNYLSTISTDKDGKQTSDSATRGGLPSSFLHANLGKSCVVRPDGTMKGAGEVSLSELTKGLIANSGNANSPIDKTIKYQGAWAINACNITQMKDPKLSDIAFSDGFPTVPEGFKGYGSPTELALNSESPPSLIFSKKQKPKRKYRAFNTSDQLKFNNLYGGTSYSGPDPYPDAKVSPYRWTREEIEKIQRVKDQLKDERKEWADRQLDSSTIGDSLEYYNLFKKWQERQMLFRLSDEVSDATKYQLSQKYLLSQQVTSGLQNAFPCYKMYIIKSDTSDYKFYTLDSYFDFRLVQDLMVIRDRNNPVHLLRARVLVDQRYITISDSIKQKYLHDNEAPESRASADTALNMKGLSDANVYSMGRAPLRVGMRICVKMGYHTDPRQLDTIFIGTITSLNGNMNSGIYDLECHGDGRELTVPAATQQQEISGKNYSEIIAAILRSNPNVIHFGKSYGTYLERFSREHFILMAIGRACATSSMATSSALIGSGVGLACISPMLGAGYLAKTVFLTGVAATAGGLVEGLAQPFSALYQAQCGRMLTEKYHLKAENWKDNRMNEFKQWFNGSLYDAGKASSQIAAHLYEINELGHDPIDDNIYAVDIWSSFLEGESLRVNNKRSIWTILQDVKRMYPNYCLDVRPYGNRSTIFLGPPEFAYWRTDDPLYAMAPQMLETSSKEIRYDERAREAIQMHIERYANGNISSSTNFAGISDPGKAPLIPFQKQHIVTSFSDIVMNGIRATPDRGWNEVVLQYGKNANSENENPDIIQIKANQNIEPGATKRQFVSADWITDSEKARQYAVGILKEGVEKMYGGTLVIRGNPKIEPNDRVYVCDKINKMYGWIEVETVIHKFDNQSGYTTHIVPNMVCSVNSDAYMTTGHIVRKLASEKLMEVTLEGALAAAAGFTVGTVAMGALAAAAPFIATIAGLSLMSYAAYTSATEAIAGSADVLDKYSVKKDDEWLGAILETICKEQVMETSFKSGYALALLVKAVRYVKNTDISECVTKSYDYAAEYASRAKSSLLKTHENMMNKSAASLLKKLALEMEVGMSEAATPALTKKQVKKWIKELKKNETTAAQGEKWEAILEKKGGFKALEKASNAYYEASSKAADNMLKSKSIKDKLTLSGKNASRASNVVKSGFFMMLMGFIDTIPAMVEGFCINAMTNANVIVIHPLWSKQQMLMTGMDGYRQTSAFMHIKDQIMFAKKTLNDALDSFKEWRPTLYGGNEPALEGATGNAWGSKNPLDRGSANLGKGYSNADPALRKKMIDKIKTHARNAGLGNRDIVNLITMVELECPSWNPSQRNLSGSSAKGLFQFMQETGVGYNLCYPKAGPLQWDKRGDADANIEAGIKMYIINKSIFGDDGALIYLAHQQGTAGAKAIIKAAKTRTSINPNSKIGKGMTSNYGTLDGASYLTKIYQKWNSKLSIAINDMQG